MKRKFLAAMLILSIAITGCSNTKANVEENNVLISNISDSNSIYTVSNALKDKVDEKSINEFLKLVQDYNQTVENTDLDGNFIKKEDKKEYDVEKLDNLWASKKGNFIGTNCRINSFVLLKDNIKVGESKIDSSLLFMDNDSLNTENILNDAEKVKFNQLFSKVKTENTKDVKVHAEKMKEHLQKITFDENAKMVSVVIHDNLDGDFLFIGHVGVMVKTDDGVLLVEKLSFQEPYQAVKFNTEEDCYNYLYDTYKHYSDPTTSKPFIMSNADFIELEKYNEE